MVIVQGEQVVVLRVPRECGKQHSAVHPEIHTNEIPCLGRLEVSTNPAPSEPPKKISNNASHESAEPQRLHERHTNTQTHTHQTLNAQNAERLRKEHTHLPKERAGYHQKETEKKVEHMLAPSALDATWGDSTLTTER